MTQPSLMKGGTYRVTYLSENHTKRQFIGQFVKLANDPVVPGADGTDHLAFHFVLTRPTIEDLDTKQSLTLNVPADKPISFHLWQEDFINAETLTRGS